MIEAASLKPLSDAFGVPTAGSVVRDSAGGVNGAPFSCLAATLTSYSENVDGGFGGKSGEGWRGNLKQWQSQKSGMDSFLYRLDENMTASTYSLNKIPERSMESMSSSSAHSIPLYLMPRPNSVAGESPPFYPCSSPSWMNFLPSFLPPSLTSCCGCKSDKMNVTFCMSLHSVSSPEWM